MDSCCNYYILGSQEIVIHSSTYPFTDTTLTHPSIYASIHLPIYSATHPLITHGPFILPSMHHPCSQCLLIIYSVLDPMPASGIEPKLHETQSACHQVQTLYSGERHLCHNPCITHCSCRIFPLPLAPLHPSTP